MVPERFLKVLIPIVALAAMVLLPQTTKAGEPYSVVLTHGGLDGASYKARFTIEGASDILPDGQGVGSDYAVLTGSANPKGKIIITMEWVECDGAEEDLQQKRIDIMVGNRGSNGDAMRDDAKLQYGRARSGVDNSLDKVVYAFDLKDFGKADPTSKDSTLMVEATSTVQLGSTQSETYVALKLQLGKTASSTNLDHIEDNKASREKGTERYVIPTVIGGVLLGGLGWLRRKMKRRKKDGDSGGSDGGDSDDEGEEEQDDEPDELQMEIYKNFGDTLIAGDVAEQVSACIMRRKPGYPEYLDEKLTSQIQIFSDDGYMAVQDAGMVNGWKSAYIQAPESETPPRGRYPTVPYCFQRGQLHQPYSLQDTEGQDSLRAGQPHAARHA